MRLHSDTIHRDSSAFQILEHGGNNLCLVLIIQVVIIVIQPGFRIGFMSELESQFDIVVSDRLVPCALTQALFPVAVLRKLHAIQNCLIYHIPGNQLSGIAGSNRLNMRPEMFDRFFPGTVLRHPSGRLLMPCKGMPHDGQIVFFRKLYHRVRRCKSEIAFRRLHRIRLHKVFRCDCIEMIQQHFPFRPLETGRIIHISDQEIILIYGLKRSQGTIHLRILFLRSFHIAGGVGSPEHYRIQIKFFSDSGICRLKIPFQARELLAARLVRS